jgi:hypothetical protein
MSNYPNMSYCAFSNTTLAMRQILNMMREVDSLPELDLSRDEFRAFRELQDLCAQFIEGAEDLTGCSDDDGQPDEMTEWRDFCEDC